MMLLVFGTVETNLGLQAEQERIDLT